MPAAIGWSDVGSWSALWEVQPADGDGNVLTATTTVESSMGSFHMTNGFLLNNQLTDFSATPTDSAGVPIANRLAPGKRPRSSMAPTFVFDSSGRLTMVLGSPGGPGIINYVVKTLVGGVEFLVAGASGFAMTLTTNNLAAGSTRTLWTSVPATNSSQNF